MHTHKMYSLHIKTFQEVPLMTESRVGPQAAGGPSCQAPWITHSPPCLQRAAQKLAGASAVSKKALATFCPTVAWRPSEGLWGLCTSESLVPAGTTHLMVENRDLFARLWLGRMEPPSLVCFPVGWPQADSCRIRAAHSPPPWEAA